MSLFEMSPVGCECVAQCDQQCCHHVQLSDLLEDDVTDANMLMECNDNCACDRRRLVPFNFLFFPFDFLTFTDAHIEQCRKVLTLILS